MRREMSLVALSFCNCTFSAWSMAWVVSRGAWLTTQRRSPSTIFRPRGKSIPHLHFLPHCVPCMYGFSRA
jgi:hypothetical protein